MNTTLKVINVCGFGRSGSTLLGLILARSPRTVCIGESAGTWYAISVNARCSCDLRATECPFWSVVIKDCLGSEPAEAALEVIAGQRQVLRWRRLPQLLAGARTHWPLGSDVFDSARAVADLYRATAEASGSDTVVDTFSDPVHAQLLAQLPGIEYHAVHLVRDPRAVAYSWAQRASSPEERSRAEGALMLSQIPMETAAWKWLRANALTHLLAGAAASYVRVRYEDLVDDPAVVVRRIEEHTGLTPGPPLRAGEEFEVPSAHVLAGNTRLLFGGKAIRLESSTSWRTGLTGAQSWATTLRTMPLLALYGYPLVPPRR